MKRHNRLLTTCVVIAAVIVAVLSAAAATEQWRYDGWSRIMQVIADGSGGAAFFRIETNGTALSIVWLDKNGSVKYESQTVIELPAPIISCTKKELVFCRGEGNVTNPVAVIVQVDKKGNESIITDPGKALVPPTLMYGQINLRDKKGFFAVSINTNQPYRSELVRYTYK